MNGLSVPPERFAGEPPEARGLARDEVRLLVAGDGGPVHARFRDLGSFLDPGDLLVINTSATLAAAVDGRRGATGPVTVHFSTPLPEGGWVVELRDATKSRVTDGQVGEVIDLGGQASVTLLAGYPDRSMRTGSRLWVTRAHLGRPVTDYLASFGRPISYGYVRERWPLADYQTVFAREPGSAEMASAGRPFTPWVFADLAARGITVAPLVLHTGVSSLEAGETPLPERYRVPAATARLVNDTRRAGGRVVAVGTTVTRALETAAMGQRTVVAPSAGWTDLVLGPQRPARIVTGLVTGWHEPEASHWQLLEAVAGPALVGAAYTAALAEDYRWHEFGDSCLLLPNRAVRVSRRAA